MDVSGERSDVICDVNSERGPMFFLSTQMAQEC